LPVLEDSLERLRAALLVLCPEVARGPAAAVASQPAMMAVMMMMMVMKVVETIRCRCLFWLAKCP
jgi:hypothetical protein